MLDKIASELSLPCLVDEAVDQMMGDTGPFGINRERYCPGFYEICERSTKDRLAAIHLLCVSLEKRLLDAELGDEDV